MEREGGRGLRRHGVPIFCLEASALAGCTDLPAEFFSAAFLSLIHRCYRLIPPICCRLITHPYYPAPPNPFQSHRFAENLSPVLSNVVYIYTYTNMLIYVYFLSFGIIIVLFFTGGAVARVFPKKSFIRGISVFSREIESDGGRLTNPVNK